ncbi:MAG: phosphomannomutase/phosphoglucomutase [Candidatus Wildermuthbacteria bacterium]|nr:phosphomannomutase/phosphoglucomutase [Candidatus Wildermuthbacteria bacterium]
MATIERLMFREYDIRGRESDKELNASSLELLGKAYGTFLLKKGIHEAVVGHDNRATSEEFYKASIKGILSTGCNAIEIGLATTPMFYWSQYYFKAQGGLMVTASHNPAGWNGLKLALGYSATLDQEELQELYQTILQESFSKGEGKIIRKEDIFPAYQKDLLSRVSGIKPFKAVVNTGNGTAGFFAPQLLKATGCEVVEYLTNPDPSYPKYTPNPAKVEMMEDTGAKVKEVKADFGFAFDGDGDRLGLVDENGQNIWPDRYLILLSRLLLQKKPGARIVFDVKVSQALPEDIQNHGGVPIMWKTGHSHIKKKMQEEGAALGGEMSGHIYFKEGYYGFDDAFFVSLKLLEYFSSQTKKVSELIAGTPYYISSPALHAPCPDDKKYQVVEELTKEFKRDYEVIDINGARVLFGDGWGLVRATSNLPALVLRFEAKTQERLAEIEKIFRDKLKRYDFVGQEWESA